MMTVATTEIRPATTFTTAVTTKWLEQERTRLVEEMRQAIHDQNWRHLGLIVDTFARLIN